MGLIILVSVGAFLLGLVAYHFRAQKILLENSVMKERLELQDRLHREGGEKLELRLKELSQQIFEEKGQRFHQGMEVMLTPFKEKMTEFSRKVEEMHLVDTKDRLKLFSEIERIVLTGQKMSLETENLTRALKGDVKMQGNWGELILERVLEASGLREGEEFTLQGKDLKLKDEEDKHQMPDVIVNLPDQKHLIIDAKVSLVAYERYSSTGSEEDLSLFLDSLYSHIKQLSQKAYHRLDKLTSPDYVMLFVPIEGAFALAMQKDKEIFPFAWEKNIVLVSPSTLLATLRTVAGLWKQERQSKNAMEIARQAGALYDKFVGVASDFDDIQLQLQKVNHSFDGLKGKMLTGKGSLASRMENLRELGARNSKTLPPSAEL